MTYHWVVLNKQSSAAPGKSEVTPQTSEDIFIVISHVLNVQGIRECQEIKEDKAEGTFSEKLNRAKSCPEPVVQGIREYHKVRKKIKKYSL